MKFVRYMSLAGVSAGLIFSPQSLLAEENSTHKFTPEDEIAFSSSTTDAFDFSGQKVIQVRLPDGTIMANHNGTMQSVTVARVAADGSIETYCTTSEAEARAFMAGGVVGPKTAGVAPVVKTR